jgi:hypothetical protein
MAATGRRYSKDEIVQRGEAIFEQEIRAKLKKARKKDFLAIDIETGEYEIDADEMTACKRLRARIADAQVWMRRVGSRITRHFGGRGLGKHAKKAAP